MKYLFFLLLSINSAAASNISLDLGQTKTVFNRFSIPTSDTDRITTPSSDFLTSYRVTGYFDLANKDQLYFILAPLEVSYSFVSDKSFKFNNTNFNSAKSTEVNYKFNSYRFGYLWTWTSNTFRFWLGAVAKIRDANIEVVQGSSSDSYDNVGLVPLASFGFEWVLSSHLAIFHHTDALGATQGSAYDSQLEIKYKRGQFSSSVGKRILGGGADNDTVYNFAQFDTFYLRLGMYF